jgi:hypothetical protein
MKHASVLIHLVASVVLVACVSPQPPVASPTAPARAATPTTVAVTAAPLSTIAPVPSADEYAIYDAVIAANWPGQAVIVMEAATTTSYAWDVRQHSAGEIAGLQTLTADSFLAANQASYPLVNHFKDGASYVLLSQADKDKLFTRDLPGSWQRFHAAYPAAQGLLAFSRGGFNADDTQALIYFQNGNGDVQAAGYVVLLSREAGGWVVKNQLLVWIA